MLKSAHKIMVNDAAAVNTLVDGDSGEIGVFLSFCYFFVEFFC